MVCGIEGGWRLGYPALGMCLYWSVAHYVIVMMMNNETSGFMRKTTTADTVSYCNSSQRPLALAIGHPAIHYFIVIPNDDRNLHVL